MKGPGAGMCGTPSMFVTSVPQFVAGIPFTSTMPVSLPPLIAMLMAAPMTSPAGSKTLPL